ncbi:MAG: hypothetical protein Q9M91_05995 [Candidatus Dojkabacteria bacterium]|nr:hypothetical protein [Candidatus Dojkabacteria bacterium]MDQ7021351.1 hypothetical protein [Candidatus Dojkabacteria bacterium]
MFGGESAVAEVTEKVINRLTNKINRSTVKISPRSRELPIDGEIYSQNFNEQLEKRLAETETEYLVTGPEVNDRVERKANQLIEAGMESELAYERTKRTVALQGTEYAMEGIWLAERVDCLLVVEPSSESYVSRTTKLIDPDKLPVIFPASYE